MDKRYRARVNGLYVRFVSTYSKDFNLAEKDLSDPRYLTEEEKDYLLKHFPNAEIKSYSLIETDKF